MGKMTLATVMAALPGHQHVLRKLQDPLIPLNERCGVLLQQTTKQLMDAAGLKYDRDAGKWLTELLGGMGQQGSLALQLAQDPGKTKDNVVVQL
jgi:hypothetical protein